MADDEARRLNVEISYCVRCHFLPRATWIAQELLHTYADYVAALALVPAHGGILEVRVDGEVIFSNKEAGRYPEINELKEAINGRLDAADVATLRRHPGKR